MVFITNIVIIIYINYIIILCINNNSAEINNDLWKNPRPYFALQNSHEHAKGFFKFIENLGTHSQEVRQPFVRHWLELLGWDID